MLSAKHMPKGPQGQKRPSDAVGLAVHIMKLATGEIAFLVGTERFIIRDRELAVRMHSAARSR